MVWEGGRLDVYFQYLYSCCSLFSYEFVDFINRHNRVEMFYVFT